jgi:hypothetical protein
MGAKFREAQLHIQRRNKILPASSELKVLIFEGRAFRKFIAENIKLLL